MSNNFFQPKSQQGAKEGLEKKLKYFADKDYQYEFGVTLGQAFNLANVGGVIDQAKVIEIFQKILAARIDPEIIEIFDDYYVNKKKSFERDTHATSEQLPVIRLS